MEPTISEAGLDGPALTFIGLAPRLAVAEARELPGGLRMSKRFTPKVISANRLLEGDAVWLTEDDRWTPDMARRS
jgi:hypothetical protein